MPRGLPSKADLWLLAEMTKRGCYGRTVYQLEGWRLAGWLPPPVRQWLGRGQGSTSRYPLEAVPIAVALASNIRPGYPTEKVVLGLFLKGFPFPEKAVRAALRWWLDRAELSAKELESDGLAALARANTRVRASVSVDDPLLLVFDPDRKQLKNRARRRCDLKAAASIDLDLAVYDEVPHADTVIDWLKLMGMPGTAELNAPTLRANDDPAQPELGLWSLIRSRLESSPYPRTLAARTVAMMWGLLLAFVILGASDDDETAADLLTMLQNDEGALWFMNFIGLAQTLDQKVAAIMWLACSGDDFIDSGWQYAKEAWPTACQIVANIHRKHSHDFEEQALVAAFAENLALVARLDPYKFGDLRIDQRPTDLDWLEHMAAAEVSRFRSRMRRPR